MEALKKAIEGNDAAAMQRALEQLTHGAAQGGRGALQAAAPRRRRRAALAAAGGAAGAGAVAGGAAGGASEPKGDVIDAEVVDEGKRIESRNCELTNSEV